MIDLRPVGYLIGWLIVALGASMAMPLVADLVMGAPEQLVFAAIGVLTVAVGAVVLLACRSANRRPLTIQQSFMLASGIWVVFPLFGALPLIFGAPNSNFTDALFEAMSALTTTGATVFVGIDELPPGTKLWRGMLQWFGGLGIVVVAMVFLPTLKVGGMQLFRSEAFDTLGKILPKATQIALSLTSIYMTLTLSCAMCYVWAGMSGYDALVHAMTTVSTGGMANYDASFSVFGQGAHYVAVVFMILAVLPFVRFMQFAAGTARPILRDPQIHGFLIVLGVFVCALSVFLADADAGPFEPTFREVLFNVTSIATGTGYASADYTAWGSFAMALFFVLGLIGGCSGSTACSVKIFRYQLLFSAIAAEVNRLQNPRRMYAPRYDGRVIDPEVMDSVMAFFMFFFLVLGLVAMILVLLGLSPITAISGAATALANVGPGLGPEIGPSGNFAGLSDPAKWVLTFTMMLGRLELLSVLVLFTPAFWRG
jgi:trk system potassium uptake protein